MKRSTIDSMYKDIYVKGHPIFGQGLKFKADPLAFFEEIKTYNPGIQKFRFGYLPMVNLSHPELIKHVLQTNNKNYYKGREYMHLRPVLGNGLLTNEGESWLSQRRLAQPAFHKQKIQGFIEVMESSTEAMIDVIRTQPEVDLHDWMMKLTMDIVSRTMFGIQVKEDEERVEQALSVAIESSYGRVQRLINPPLWLPIKSIRRYNQSIRDLNEVVNTIISNRRQSKTRHDDLLDMFMYAEDEDTQETMSDSQLRDEVMTIFLAGHETTANALTWALYILNKHQNKQAQLLEDLKSNDWSYNTPYLNLVIKETLRLFPPAWAVGRRALENDEIGGVEVPAKSNITICAYQVHRDPELWDQPDVFMPERFEYEKEYHKFQYFPFGGGPRFCIGNNFAQLEMQIILSQFLRQFEYDCSKEIEKEPMITLRPKGGLSAQLTQR